MKTTRLHSVEGASAELKHHGAHLTSWQTATEKEWLFLSSLSLFEKDKAIRGGVPIIFPQFNEFGPGPRHGFARTSHWHLTQPPTFSNNRCQCVMTLEDSEDSLTVWPHKFRADYTTSIDDDSLTLTLKVTNTDNKPFQFTAALHTYLAVSDIHKIQINGLQGLEYWDNNGSDFQQRHTEKTTKLELPNGQIDRVYFKVVKPLLLEDNTDTLAVGNKGFSDVVIWNPGPTGAQDMLDLADLEYRNMLCIEAAVIDQPITLEPGDSWCGAQILRDQNAQP